jgi:hypothetical protein
MRREICTYCANKSSGSCPTCQEEGKYRYFEPDSLADWELPPELPSMRQLVDYPPYERLAILYLSVALEQRQRTRRGDI